MIDDEVIESADLDNRPLDGSRIIAAVVVGVLMALLLAATVGLFPGRQPVGAGDNGDGSRLYCGVGLTPIGVESTNWKGGVVLDFARSPACDPQQPSSALAVMKVAAMNQDPFSLLRLGWLYVGLFSAVAGISAWALTARGRADLWLLVPPALPLLDRDFTRFMISTFAEPAGLLGAFALLCGVAVASATDRDRSVERVIAVCLLGGGGLLAVTAKIGFIPVAVIAVVLAATVPIRFGSSIKGWSAWLVGPVVAVLVAVGVLLSTPPSLEWQAELYPAVNAHNVIYTLVLTELPGSATRLGLPEEAGDFAGDAYFPDGPAGVAGADLVAADPDRYRNRAWSLLARSPAALADAVGIGLQATRGRSLDYLPSEPWSAASDPPELGDVLSGQQGVDSRSLRSWLDGMSMPWIPSVLVLFGLIAGAASVRWRNRPASGFARLAGVAAAAALGVAAVSVLGDGYFEIAKHVWLAAYFLDVTLLALLGVGALVALPRLRSWNDRRAGGAAPETAD